MVPRSRITCRSIAFVTLCRPLAAGDFARRDRLYGGRLHRRNARASWSEVALGGFIECAGLVLGKS